MIEYDLRCSQQNFSRKTKQNVLNSSRVRTTRFIIHIPQKVMSQGGDNMKYISNKHIELLLKLIKKLVEQ
ncbi:MAG: hypothetical protein NZ927_09650, partial [Candidatus Calescibacterium sp.]|nr:hypothetical protein [Candidatus Calescibacterium sp.]